MCARTLTSQKVVNTDQGADGQHRRDDRGAIEASYDTSPRLPAHQTPRIAERAIRSQKLGLRRSMLTGCLD